MPQKAGGSMNSITDIETTEDLFNLSPYINGLAKFTSKCQTPMTIALQGSWGSGKSSMMNLLQSRIISTDNNALFIRFNTWQYSQFQFSDNLPITFLSGLIEKISDAEAENNNNTIHTVIKETAKTLLKLTADIAIGSTAGQVIGEAIDSFDEIKKDNSKRQTVVKTIEELKKGFAELVKKRCEEDHKDRIVFFIDDLDRLQPQKAVELMEILKIIIECKACVFVLAIDYEVVSRGVRAKYGNDIVESKVKNFFDKIIQVPFSLPVSKYDLSHYIEQLIDASGLSAELKEIKNPDGHIASEYVDMIRLSIGGNPRSIKKLLNTFRLLTFIISEAKNVSYPILFSALLLQLAYEKVYNYLLENCGSKEQLEEFFKLFDNAESLRKSESIFQERIGLKEYTELEQEYLCLFLNKFCESIVGRQNGSEDELTDELADVVRSTLFTSAVTATTAEASNTEINFDTKIDDIFETVKCIKAGIDIGKNVDQKLISEAKKAVAQNAGKQVSCVSSECTRGLGIKADTFENYVDRFLNQKDKKLVEVIIETNKNKRILAENVRRKFSTLL